MKSKSNMTHGAVSATPRIALAFSAALVALAAACICSVAPALASSGSGGITIGGDTPEAPPAEASKYVRLWDKVAAHDKHWAKQTAQCESGGDPQAIGGGGKYRGAFQFMLSTLGDRAEVAGRRPDRLLVQDPGRRRRRADAQGRHRPLARLRLAA